MKPNKELDLLDQPALARIAMEDPDRFARRQAICRMKDQVILAKIAMEDADASVRWESVWQLTDQPTLAHIAVMDPDADVRHLAKNQPGIKVE